MYLGTSDAIYLADELKENILKKNWNRVLELLNQLNSLQAIYVFNQIDLSEIHQQQLFIFLKSYMNLDP